MDERYTVTGPGVNEEWRCMDGVNVVAQLHGSDGERLIRKTAARLNGDSARSVNGGVSRNGKRWLVSDTYLSGARTGRLDGEVVDEEFVESFTSIEARRFFINLGGSEQMTKTKTGIITVKSTDPNGESRTVKFTPVLDN